MIPVSVRIGYIIEIYIHEKWCFFEYRGGHGSQVKSRDTWYNTSDLSDETIKWLHWHNTLKELKNYL